MNYEHMLKQIPEPRRSYHIGQLQEKAMEKMKLKDLRLLIYHLRRAATIADLRDITLPNASGDIPEVTQAIIMAPARRKTPGKGIGGSDVTEK